jgi:hypothetical protein
VDERERRIGENEAIYREVNERIRDISERIPVLSETLTIVCECGRPECTERLTIDPETYANVRANPILFVMTPGHEEPSVERVVERTPAYVVVAKHRGGPAGLAEETA